MFTGVFAPLPTPFDEAGALDLLRLRRALPAWLATPLSGVVVLGTTGEAGLLSDDEADALVAETRAGVGAGRPLIAGAGRESTDATVRAAKRAASLGADAVLVRTPGFFRAQMNSEALTRHYLKVADDSPAPVLLYNFAAATGVNLLPQAVAQLSQHPNVVGIKESGSDIAQITDLVAAAPPGFSVLAGSASTFLAALSAGVSGGILALAALLPAPCVQLFDLWREGRIAEAQSLQRRLLPMARLISSGHGLPGLKSALAAVGCDVGYPRPPLLPASPAVAEVMAHALGQWKECPV